MGVEVRCVCGEACGNRGATAAHPHWWLTWGLVTRGTGRDEGRMACSGVLQGPVSVCESVSVAGVALSRALWLALLSLSWIQEPAWQVHS